MVKKIKSSIKLQIAAGMANPSPPVGPALGQRGINIMEFCKLFNAKTLNIESGLLVPVIITVYSDRSFTFVVKSAPASALLKKAMGITKLNETTNRDKFGKYIGKITNMQIIEIARIKSLDMTGSDLEAMAKSIAGTARSMGLLIDKEDDDC